MLLAILFSCNESSTNVLPNVNLKYLEKYHCWPYDVNVYSVEGVMGDSLFHNYPLQSYFGNHSKYEISTWSKYSSFDKTLWSGMNKSLKECDGNIELYDQIIKGDEIYYSGSYHYNKNLKNIKKRRYEEILFFNLKNNKVHIFKNINKVY